MNKLDIAIRLLQLLNERSEVDSKTVAHELHVSLRTAQRYLTDLSTMPCVTNGRNHNTYTLDPEYHLNQALLGANNTAGEIEGRDQPSSSETDCPLCRGTGDGFNCTRPHCMLFSNKYRIDRLTALIERRLKDRRRGFL